MKKNIKNNGCPFHSGRNNCCTYKNQGPRCIFKNPNNCPFFKDWQVLRESIVRLEKMQPTPLKTPKKSILDWLRGKESQ